jgi:integrase
MAVIKNNKTGMWEVRTYYKDLTGARKQKTKRGFAKKSEALEWERNFKLKENQSISMSFKSFVDIYLTDLEPRIKRNTFLTKKHIIETKILPYFGKRKLDDIRTPDVIQWQNEIMMLKKDNGELFSPTYLKTIHNQLSAILNHAVNMYGLKDNVARKAGTMGKEENKEMEFWTQDEFQAFLECVADKPISYYAFEMLYWTGIREGDDDDKIRLNQRKPSKYKGLRRFGPEKNLQRINKFMKERPIFYKNLIQMKENIRFYLRCFYCITKVMILQFNSENRTELARNG